MNKTMAAIACSLLLVLALPVGSSSLLDQNVLEPQPVGLLGATTSCDVSGQFVFQYTQSDGETCTSSWPGYIFTHDISAAKLECADFCYAYAYGGPSPFAYRGVQCNEGGGAIIVSYDLGQHVHVTGDCFTFGSGDMSAAPGFYAFGYGYDGFRFVFADNLVDAVLF